MIATAFVEIGKDMTYDIHSTDDRLDFMVLGQGKTITEAKKDFYSCLEEIKDLYVTEGKTFDFADLTFQFKYDIASFLKYSPFTLTWLSYITGIAIERALFSSWRCLYCLSTFTESFA